MKGHRDSDATRTKRILPALLLAGVSAIALSACNTIEGAGQDIENTGEAIEDSADEET